MVEWRKSEVLLSLQTSPMASSRSLQISPMASSRSLQTSPMASSRSPDLFRVSEVLRKHVLTDVTPTGKSLGFGSYGSLIEVTYQKQKCAAKEIHEGLLDFKNPGVYELIRRYVQECELTASLDHPNITKFLGICYLPKSQLPLLVMERLEMNLDDLLEVVPNFPLPLKLHILEDINRGLHYLHTRNPPIIHRDLTARNILLTSSLSAKICDMGNSCILNLRPGQLVQTLSKCPGTMVYMPPEAMVHDCHYGLSLDIFSFGVVALYTLTQVFPGELLFATYPDPDNPTRIMVRTEVERRAKYIEKLEASISFQALVDLVKECLDNEPTKRPSSEKLLGHIQTIRMEVEKSLSDGALKNLDKGRVHFAIADTRENEYLEDYHYFVNNKVSLALLFLKFLFIGPPRLGKTTTLRRLMGKIVDLQSAGEEKQDHPSTGAVEAEAVLVRHVSNTTAVITQSEWSVVESVEDEVHMLLHNLVDTLTSSSSAATTSSSAEIQTHSLSTVSVAETTSSQPTSQSAVETERIAHQLTPAPQSSGKPQPAYTGSLLEVIAMFTNAKGSNNLKDVKRMFKAYLRVEDTGGQPELMDMLPALTIGPGLYLLFINLQNDLDHHYMLTYRNKSGTSTHPVESVYNVKEMLFSSLASIWCSSASSSEGILAKDEGIIPGVSDILKTSKSKAYIVGTHKDKVTEDHIKELNEQLQKIVESTEFSDLVEYFSQDELIVAVDNMAGGAEEVKKVQALIERCMDRCFKELKVPVVWLLFSLVLRRKEQRTVSLEDCMHLSEALGMSFYETEVALWFLYHHAGVLMYFPDIPELKDLVIVDVQIVYDSVTNLILNAMSWAVVGVHRSQEFKKTGKFTIGQLRAITSTTSDDFIPIHKLVVLLEYLHIIARISSHQQTSSSSEEVTYIMPCVLDSANKEELDTISKEPHEVCPIMVRFKCGFVPVGVFPAMIACLINNESFTVIEDGIKKNIVQFRYGVHWTLVTFLCRSMYYEFIISHFYIPEIEVHEECSVLRQEIEATFERIYSRVNYSSIVAYEFAFDCPIHTECGREHLCVVKRRGSSPVMMECLQNMKDRTPVRLTDQHKLWWGQGKSGICYTKTNLSKVEVGLFTKEFARLVISSHSSIDTLSDFCLSEELISQNTYDDLLELNITSKEKARKLLRNVKEIISEDPQALTKFLQVLQELDICGNSVSRIKESMKN